MKVLGRETGGSLANPLHTLLELDEAAKASKGLKHTPREIFQQPETWKDTYSYCLGRKAEIRGFLENAGIWNSNDSPMVFLVGAGSSDYIGRALVHLLRRQWRRGVSAVASTELLLDAENYLLPGRKYLWISFSRSGDSPEGVAVLQNALRAHPQVRHLVVTCNAQAKMVQICAENRERALALILGEAVNDRGLAMTSSFTNMVVAGQVLAHIQDLPAYAATLDCMAKLGARVLATAPEVAQAIVERGSSRACFVGSAALAAVADECALKLVELTGGKVQTMAQTTLGLRHGPMSAIDQGTLFVQFLSGDSRHRNYEMDLLGEVGKKKLAGARLVVTGEKVEALAGLAEYVLCLDAPPNFPDDCRPPLDVMIGQLLGLFASLRAGLQPDNPSPSGAISRVVSGVKLHL